MESFIYPTVETLEDLMFDKAPKILDSERYQDLSLGAKYLYIRLRSRQQLSIKNKWIDDEGHPYCIFSNEKLTELLGVSKPTLIKFKKELESYKLLKEKQQGMGKPNILYVGEPSYSREDLYEIVKKEENIASETVDENISYPQAQTIDTDKELKKLTPRSKESLLQEVKKFNPSKIESSNNDYSNTQSINKKEKNERLTDKNILVLLSKKYESDIITAAIQKANKAKENGTVINNLYSYLDAICKETKSEKEILNKSNNYRKTDFHMSEQRSDNYTADELEDVMKRKRREYVEKMKASNTELSFEI